VFVERHFRFKAQRVARTESAGNDAKLFSRFDDGVPHSFTRRGIAGNVNLKAVFAGVAGASDQTIRQGANRYRSEPVVLNHGKIGVRQLLQNFCRARTLNRELRIRVAQVLYNAIIASRILPNPLNILFTGACVNDE